MGSKASGVTLDTIVIDIESNASSAVNGIEALAASLVNLKQSMNKGFGNLKKLSVYLGELRIAAQGLDKVADNLESVSKITSALSLLSTISDPKGLRHAVSSLKDLPGVFDKIDPSTLQNVALVSNSLAKTLTPLSEIMGRIGQGYAAMDDLAKKYGMTLTKIKKKTEETEKSTNKFSDTLRKLPSALRDLKTETGKFGKDSINVFKKVHSKIKQIGLSLLGTRTIFTATRKAISEYMQMDAQLTKEIQNLWRALGAQLAPAVEYVMFLFKHIVRVIYSVVYALTGIDLIARANAKALAAMGQSAKDALGNLQKFDDLNVVEFDKGKNEIPQIELDKIDLTPIQKVIDWMRKLKAEIENAWKTGKWGGVFNVLYEGLMGIIDAVPWYDIGTKIREAVEKVPWKEVWDKVYNIFKESFKGLGEFINGLFGADEDSSFGTDLLFSLIAIYGIIQLIKGANGLGGMLETLGLISKAPSLVTLGVIFGGILVIALAIGKAIDTWKKYLSDPTSENKLKLIFDTLLTVAAMVAGVAILFGMWPVAIGAAIVMIGLLIGKFLAENWDTISKWFTDIFKAIGDWCKKYLIDPTVQSFKDFVNLLKMAWDSIVYNWKAFWDLMGKTCKTAINSIIGTIEGLINGIIWGINGLSSGLRKIGNKLFEIIGVDVTFDPISNVKIPRLETGTNEVPYEGLYHLHQGEAVVPKKYNPALGNGTDEEVGQKLDTLISIMSNMNFTNVVNIGNKTLYKEQQRYNKTQNDKYGTTVNL